MNAMVKAMKNKLNSKRSGKKGFTLMEMLIVVAIIAILVAIAIPTFNNALDNARKATDQANIRSAYAEHQIYEMLKSTDTSVKDATVSDSGLITFSDTSTYQLQYFASVDKTKSPWEGTGEKK